MPQQSTRRGIDACLNVEVESVQQRRELQQLAVAALVRLHGAPGEAHRACSRPGMAVNMGKLQLPLLARAGASRPRHGSSRRQGLRNGKAETIAMDDVE